MYVTGHARENVDLSSTHANTLARQVLSPECPRRIVQEYRKYTLFIFLEVDEASQWSTP